MKMKKHKMVVETRELKNTVNSYMQLKTVGEMEWQGAAQEATLTFHTEIHNHSFKLMDRTTAVVKNSFQAAVYMLSVKNQGDLSQWSWDHLQLN